MMIFGCGGDSIKAISGQQNQSKPAYQHALSTIFICIPLKKLSQVIDKRLKETSDDTPGKEWKFFRT